MLSASSAPRTLLPILAIMAGVPCIHGACSLRSLDYLGNGHGQDGALMDSDAADPGTGGMLATGDAASGGAIGSGGTGGGATTSQGGSFSTGGASGGSGKDGAMASGGLSFAGGTSGDSSVFGSGGNSSQGGNAAADAAQDASGGGAGGGTGASGGGTGGSGTGGSGTGGSATGSSGTGGSGTGGATVPSGLVTTCPGAVPSGITADWCSCAQWGELDRGDATYYNDIWGSGAGPQCIWVAGGKWGTTANHPSGGGVKSYPNISYSPGTVLSAINTFTSSFDVTVPTSGAWEATYAIYAKNRSGKQAQIMLWMNFTRGAVSPLSDAGTVSDVSVGGHSWDVSYSSAGGKIVVSLLRTSNTNSGTVDIKAVLDWIMANKNFFDSSYTLDQMQFGFVIVTDGTPQSFVVNSFSVSSS